MNTEDMTNERLLVTLEMSGWIERSTVARTIELLIEVERRKLDLELSYTSMFDFCVRRLRFSENEAYLRLACARLIAKLPSILDPLRDGRVTLTNVVLLRDVFTAENVEELLAAIAGKTRKQVEAIVARLQPKPDVPDSIQLLPVQPALVPAAPGATTPIASQPSPPSPAKATASARPLSEDRYAVGFTADAVFLEKLERVGGLVPGRPKESGLVGILEHCLDFFIAHHEEQMLGKTKRPRKTKPSKDPGYISAATRRDVLARDEMQCTFVSAEGQRCPARERLELDHRQPRARGGTGDASNLRLLCARHNRYEAERVFGREHIERSINTAQAKRRAGDISPATDEALGSASTPSVNCGTLASAAAPGEEFGSPPTTGDATLAANAAKSTAETPRGSDEDDAGKRAALRFALVQDQGFKSTDVDRLIAAMATDRASWSRPLGSLFIEALRHLCEKARPPARRAPA